MKSRWVSRIDKYSEQTGILDRQYPGQTSILERQVSWTESILNRQISWTDKYPGQTSIMERHYQEHTSILDRQVSESSKSPGLANLWYKWDSHTLNLLDGWVFQTLCLLDRQVPLKGKNLGYTSLLVGQVNWTDKSPRHKISRQTSFGRDEAPGQSSPQDYQGSRTDEFLGLYQTALPYSPRVCQINIHFMIALCQFKDKCLGIVWSGWHKMRFRMFMLFPMPRQRRAG